MYYKLNNFIIEIQLLNINFPFFVWFCVSIAKAFPYILLYIQKMFTT